MAIRHYKALMRKNFINWKRTPLGSCAELFCPILFMSLVLLLRVQLERVDKGSEYQYENSKFQYPVVMDQAGDLSKNLELGYNEQKLFMEFTGQKLKEKTAGCEETLLSTNKCPWYEADYLSQAPILFDYKHCQETDRG